MEMERNRWMDGIKFILIVLMIFGAQKGVDWQFTNEEARVKLKHLYPLVNF